MTKQEAIENHRKLWNWIADTSEKENRCVDKDEYFYSNNIKKVLVYCYCCEFTLLKCSKCPIRWSGVSKYPCTDLSENESDWRQSEYGMWCKSFERNDVQECIRLARIIANLPENPDAE